MTDKRENYREYYDGVAVLRATCPTGSQHILSKVLAETDRVWSELFKLHELLQPEFHYLGSVDIQQIIVKCKICPWELHENVTKYVIESSKVDMPQYFLDKAIYLHHFGLRWGKK